MVGRGGCQSPPPLNEEGQRLLAEVLKLSLTSPDNATRFILHCVSFEVKSSAKGKRRVRANPAAASGAKGNSKGKANPAALMEDTDSEHEDDEAPMEDSSEEGESSPDEASEQEEERPLDLQDEQGEEQEGRSRQDKATLVAFSKGHWCALRDYAIARLPPQLNENVGKAPTNKMANAILLSQHSIEHGLTMGDWEDFLKQWEQDRPARKKRVSPALECSSVLESSANRANSNSDERSHGALVNIEYQRLVGLEHKAPSTNKCYDLFEQAKTKFIAVGSRTRNPTRESLLAAANGSSDRRRKEKASTALVRPEVVCGMTGCDLTRLMTTLNIRQVASTDGARRYLILGRLVALKTGKPPADKVVFPPELLVAVTKGKVSALDTEFALRGFTDMGYTADSKRQQIGKLLDAKKIMSLSDQKAVSAMCKRAAKNTDETRRVVQTWFDNNLVV